MSDDNKNFDVTDRAIADLLRQVGPPSDLRRNLMALAPQKPRPAVPFWIWGFACALLVIAFVASLSFRGPSLDKAQSDLSSFLASDFQLSVTGKPISNLQAWLAGQNAAVGTSVPGSLAKIAPEGCRVIEWEGHRASLICFDTGGGKVIHLVMFEPGTFRNLPTSPKVAERGPWSMASWRGPDADYLMFGQTSAQDLRRFL
jgi:hypothetical protein